MLKFYFGEKSGNVTDGALRVHKFPFIDEKSQASEKKMVARCYFQFWGNCKY